MGKGLIYVLFAIMLLALAAAVLAIVWSVVSAKFRNRAVARARWEPYTEVMSGEVWVGVRRVARRGWKCDKKVFRVLQSTVLAQVSLRGQGLDASAKYNDDLMRASILASDRAIQFNSLDQ